MPDDGFVSILPSASTPFLKAVEKTSGERWDDLDVDIIRRFKDPWTCPSHLLNFLAFERSVDLWNETWDEEKKRSVIGSAPADHRIKGTRAGLRRYIDLVGGDLRQVVTAPQGFFAARAPSAEAQDAYIRKLPEVRLYTARQQGISVGFFANRDHAGHAHAVADRGRDLLARKATLVRDGIETDLTLIRLPDGSERIATGGRPGVAPIADASFAGWTYCSGSIEDAKIYTVAVGGAIDRGTKQLRLSAILPGLTPMVPNIDRASKRLAAGPATIAGRSGAGRSFATLDRSQEMTFDRIRLYDAAVIAPIWGIGGFADHSRVSMPRFKAEIMVEAEQPGYRRHLYANETFAGKSFAVASDLRQFNEIVDAARLAQAARDRIALTLQTTRPQGLPDGINLGDGFRFGQRVDRNL